MIKGIDNIMELLENNSNKRFAVRGMSKREVDNNFKMGDYMNFSIDNWEGRDNDYHDNMPLLSGTCGFVVDGNTMYEDDIVKMIEKALIYSNCNTVCLMTYTDSEEGFDELEVICSNDGDPACFYDYVEL